MIRNNVIPAKGPHAGHSQLLAGIHNRINSDLDSELQRVSGMRTRLKPPPWRGLRHSGMTMVFLGIIFFSSLANAETIHYAITHWGFKMGEATLSNIGLVEFHGQKTFLIDFKAQAINFFDEEKIYTDPVHFYPLFVERDLNIFGKKEKILETYDQARHEMRLAKTFKGKQTETVYKNSGTMDNIYGFIWRYRQHGSFQIGDVLDVPLPTTSVKIQLVKRAPLTIQGKDYDSFYMQSRPDKYKIWFDSSAQKKPLRISGAIGMALDMEMIGYEA